MRNQLFSSVEEFKKCSQVRKIWQIPFCKDRFNEDNDTEDEQSDDSSEDSDDDKDSLKKARINAIKNVLGNDKSKKQIK